MNSTSFSDPTESLILGILKAIEAFVTEDSFCLQSKAQLTQYLLNMQDVASVPIKQAAQRVCQRYCDEGAALMASGVSTSTDLRIQLYNACSHRMQRVERTERARSTETMWGRTGSGNGSYAWTRQYLNSKGKGSSSKGSSSSSRRSKDVSSSSKSKDHSSNSKSKDYSSNSKSKDYSSNSKHSKDYSSASRGFNSHSYALDNQSSLMSDEPADASTHYIAYSPPAIDPQPRYIPVNRHTIISSDYNGANTGDETANESPAIHGIPVARDRDENGAIPITDTISSAAGVSTGADISESDVSPVEEDVHHVLRIQTGDSSEMEPSDYQAEYNSHQMSMSAREMMYRLNSDSSDDELMSHKYNYSESEEESPERRRINEIASVFHVFIQLYQSCSYICIIQQQYSVLYDQLLKVVADINQFVGLLARCNG